MSRAARRPSTGRDAVLIIVSAPSGAGKTTLVRRVMEKVDNISFSISHTTRPKRNNEKAGVDYHFVSDDQFSSMVKKDEFAEWATVHGNKYGTSFEELDKAARDNIDLFIEIDAQGANQLKEQLKDGVFVCIIPPSFETLKERLKTRGTEEESVINDRLDAARQELKEMEWFDYGIVNDDLETASDELEAILRAEGCRMSRRKAELKKRLRIS